MTIGRLLKTIGHLSHSDLVIFLKRGRSAIRSNTLSAPRGQPEDLAEISAPSPSGFIVVKENVCDDATQGTGEVFDEVDSSITRSSSRWLQAFTEAGLQVVVEEVQDGMPSDLYRVKTSAHSLLSPMRKLMRCRWVLH